MNVNEQVAPEDRKGAQEAGGDDSTWLRLAQQCYSASSDFLTASVQKDWQRSIAHFQNRHAPESKFHTAAYAARSKVFAPKTRMAGRSSEAALAAAMFSTNDLIDISPENDENEVQKAGAMLIKALLQYRLKRSIPWFLTVIGAYQDAFVSKVCATYQHWQLERVKELVPAVDDAGNPQLDEMGQPLMQETLRTVQDKPCITMIPPENIRFDPACDWRDPVGSSPFLIRVVPMFAEQVLEKAQQQGWRPITAEELKAATQSAADLNSLRREREAQGKDPTDSQLENRPVFLHENFVRKGGEEWVYWTLGTTRMLSEPRLLAEQYPIGERPVVIGRIVVESHRPYPSSPADLAAGLQEYANDIGNQRRDNVALAMNKRYGIKRGRQIDVETLMRSVPGSGIVLDDPVNDLRVIETPDVTSSAYVEQDRTDVQIDEMLGNFSQASVQSNRAIGETVGGMNLLSNSASVVGEYNIRTFVETWVEPVLRQLCKLEALYEADATVLALAAKSAKLPADATAPEVLNLLLEQPIELSVNVGIGATNPQQKLERLKTALISVSDLPGVVGRIKSDEVISEVFGALGYKNGSRFFIPEDQVEPQGPPPDPMAEVRAAEIELKRERMQVEMRQFDQEMALKRELALTELALKENLTLAQLESRLQVDMQRDLTTRQIKALDATNVQNEIALKRSIGSGI